MGPHHRQYTKDAQTHIGAAPLQSLCPIYAHFGPVIDMRHNRTQTLHLMGSIKMNSRELVSLVGKLLICISLMGRRFEPKTPFLFGLDARSQPNVVTAPLCFSFSLVGLSAPLLLQSLLSCVVPLHLFCKRK